MRRAAEEPRGGGGEEARACREALRRRLNRKLLEEIRVVEFATLIAGPFCGLTLSDLGTNIVKVETRRGATRGVRSCPFGDDGESAFFHSLNRGKRSVVVNAGDAHRLAEQADVVIENAPTGWTSGPPTCPSGLSGARSRGRALAAASVRWTRACRPRMGLMELTGERDGPPLARARAADRLHDRHVRRRSPSWRRCGRRSGPGTARISTARCCDSAATLTSTVAVLAERRVRARPHRHQEATCGCRAPMSPRPMASASVIALHNTRWEALCAGARQVRVARG